MGPFTDMDNDIIKQNELSSSYQDIFENLLSNFLLYLYNNNIISRIICIPSNRDIHHFSCYPQQRYFIQSFNKNLLKNNYFLDCVDFISNPSELNINGLINIGITTVDFLFHCCCQELNKNQRNDRLLKIMQHCIEQQSFYPLMPAQKSIRMDYNYSHKLFFKQQPHIFIIPSKLNRFAKIIKTNNNDVIGINPSFLTKSNSGGTYALITIHLPQNNDNSNQPFDVCQNTRVDIFRI